VIEKDQRTDLMSVTVVLNMTSINLKGHVSGVSKGVQHKLLSKAVV
jgi:hypothetical protein